MLPSPMQTTPELEKRLPYDKAHAKALLAEAGYPNGFEVTLDCPNNRYVNDEKICQALAAMWAQIGVETQGERDAAREVSSRRSRSSTPACTCWAGAARRPTRSSSCSRCSPTYNGKGDGDYNYGRYTNAKLDDLIAKIKIDMNAPQRLDEIHAALAGAERRDQPPAAAPAGDPVGDALERHGRAPRRQQRHSVLGDDPVGAAGFVAAGGAPARAREVARHHHVAADRRPRRRSRAARRRRRRRCAPRAAMACSTIAGRHVRRAPPKVEAQQAEHDRRGRDARRDAADAAPSMSGASTTATTVTTATSTSIASQPCRAPFAGHALEPVHEEERRRPPVATSCAPFDGGAERGQRQRLEPDSAGHRGTVARREAAERRADAAATSAAAIPGAHAGKRPAKAWRRLALRAPTRRRPPARPKSSAAIAAPSSMAAALDRDLRRDGLGRVERHRERGPRVRVARRPSATNAMIATPISARRSQWWRVQLTIAMTSAASAASATAAPRSTS